MAELEVAIVSCQEKQDWVRLANNTMVPASRSFDVVVIAVVQNQETYEAWRALVGKKVKVVSDG